MGILVASVKNKKGGGQLTSPMIITQIKAVTSFHLPQPIEMMAVWKMNDQMIPFGTLE